MEMDGLKNLGLERHARLLRREKALREGAGDAGEKYPMLEQTGFWKAGWWDPASVAPFMQKLSERFTKAQPARHRHSLESMN